MAIEDFLISETQTSNRALPVNLPQTTLADVVIQRPQTAAPSKKSERVRNTLGTVLDLIAGAGGRTGNGYWAAKERLQKEAEAAQLAETQRMQAEALRMQRDNAIAGLGVNPNDRDAMVSLFQSGGKEAGDIYKAFSPPPAAQGSLPREVQIARILSDPTTDPRMREQLERFANPDVLTKTGDGGVIATPKFGVPSGQQAGSGNIRVLNGGGTLPDTFRTIGDLVSGGAAIRGITGTTSVVGPFQITADTWAQFGKGALGDNWRNMPIDDPRVHDRVGEAIFNSARGSKKTLRGRWDALTKMSDQQVDALRVMPWSQAREIIAQAEGGAPFSAFSGGSSPQVRQIVPGAPKAADYQVVQTPDGYASVNKITGQVTPLGIQTMPRGGAGGGTAKQQATAQKQATAENRIVSILGEVDNATNQLDRLRAAPSRERSTAENIMAWAGGTRAGQMAGEASGREAQRYQAMLNATFAQFTSQLKDLTGMSAQQLNSNFELENFKNLWPKPTDNIEVQRDKKRQIDALWGRKYAEWASGSMGTTTQNRPPLSSFER